MRLRISPSRVSGVRPSGEKGGENTTRMGKGRGNFRCREKLSYVPRMLATTIGTFPRSKSFRAPLRKGKSVPSFRVPSGKKQTTFPSRRSRKIVCTASLSTSLLRRGKAPSCLRKNAARGFRKSSSLATKYTRLGEAHPRTTGSR